MENYIFYIIEFVVAWIFGFHIGTNLMRDRMKRNISENPDELIASIQQIKQLSEEVNEMKEGIEVVVEQHNNRFFVYNKSSHLFLGQGESIDDAMKTVTERFPNQVFMYEINT